MWQTATLITGDEENDVNPFAYLEDDEEELETHEVMIKTKLTNPDK